MARLGRGRSREPQDGGRTALDCQERERQGEGGCREAEGGSHAVWNYLRSGRASDSASVRGAQGAGGTDGQRILFVRGARDRAGDERLWSTETAEQRDGAAGCGAAALCVFISAEGEGPRVSPGRGRAVP